MLTRKFSALDYVNQGAIIWPVFDAELKICLDNGNFLSGAQRIILEPGRGEILFCLFQRYMRRSFITSSDIKVHVPYKRRRLLHKYHDEEEENVKFHSAKGISWFFAHISCDHFSRLDIVVRMVDILIGFSTRSKRARAVTGEGKDSCCPEAEKRGRLSSSGDMPWYLSRPA